MILYMLLFVYFMNRYENIIKRCENELETYGDIGSMIVILYSIGSIYAFMKLL